MQKPRTIAVLSHLGKPNVAEAATGVARWLRDKGVVARLPEEEARSLGLAELGVPEAELALSDVAVSLGGDGTILRTVRILGGSVPVMGVNFGRFGFLSEAEVSELYPALDRLVDGDFDVQERMMLDFTTSGPQGEAQGVALNEVVVERRGQQRMLELDVYVDGEFFYKYMADGLIFATPTGSTAYSFSAGGPIVAPMSEVITMTPICPHSLFGRPIVLSMGERIEVRMPPRPEVTIGVDGLVAKTKGTPDRLAVTRASQNARLVRLGRKSFYTTLREKLNIWDTWSR